MTTLHDLSDMQYDFVSLVDYPANQAARVTLAKRDVRKAGKVDPDDEGYEGDGESNPSKAGETTRAKMLSRTSKATSRVRPAPAGSPDDDPVTDGEDDEDELEKRGGKLSRDENGLEGDDGNEGTPDDESDRSPNETGRLRGAVRTSKGARTTVNNVRKAQSTASSMSAADGDDDDDEHNEQPADARPNPNLNKRADQVVISKADFEALRKGLERAEARAAAAEELAKAEAEKVSKREAIAKVATWAHVPQISEAFADHWLAITKSAPAETVEALEKALDSAEAALRSGTSIYGSHGRANVGANINIAKSNDPMAPITAAAQEIRKSNPTISLQQAIVKVMQTQPELAAQYRESMGFVPEGGYSE